MGEDYSVFGSIGIAVCHDQFDCRLDVKSVDTFVGAVMLLAAERNNEFVDRVGILQVIVTESHCGIGSFGEVASK